MTFHLQFQKLWIKLSKNTVKDDHAVLVESTVDACEFMKNRSAKPLLNMLYMHMEPYSNINHTCPYEVSENCNYFH